MTEGLSGYGFDKDLREGQAREDAFVHILLRSKVEIKSDKRCRETGNLFVEYSQPDGNGGEKPSGIKATIAQRWAFEFDTDCWLVVPTERVLQLARRAYKMQGSVTGGDYDRYKGVLIPFGWFVASALEEADADAELTEQIGRETFGESVA